MTTKSIPLRARLESMLADGRAWAGITVLCATLLYLSAAQWGVNGAYNPYTTDVGEIQNALPRWGTIHYPGYPLYSLAGSAFVSALRLVGIEPAAGASLFSALWGVVATCLLFALACELGAGPAWAALGAIAAGLSRSFWIDASLAEIHTMSAALWAGILYFALRFGRHGRQWDLRGLVLTFSIGIMHQRTLLFLAPAILLLIWGRWREVRLGWLPALSLAAAGPLTYLYLPIRAWQGANWTFGAVGTWSGFLQIFLDTKVERVVALPGTLDGWLSRVGLLVGLIQDDLWLPVLALGLAALWLARRSRPLRVPLALTLAWLPSALLAIVIWEGSVSDALLAAKLPVVQMAGVGLALAAQAVARLNRRAALVPALGLAALIGAEVGVHRPAVLAITRDPSVRVVIAEVEQVAQPQGGPPTTFMALWGHDYWSLAYAQAYQGQLPGLSLVDHNADVAAIARRERLLTLSRTFYQLPLTWWDERLGQAHLSSPAPGIVAVSPEACMDGGSAEPSFDLGNGIAVLSARVEPREGQWLLRLQWLALRQPESDYSVAVHALAKDPPAGAEDILAQADCQNPVCGWYPTSRWQPGEVVDDTYLVDVPPGRQPVAIRVGMYRVLADGAFENSPWLTLPLNP